MSTNPSNGPAGINPLDSEFLDSLNAFLARPMISDATQAQFWSPPEDPDKPTLPYIPGLTLQIHRHMPPPHFVHSLRKNIQPRPLLSDSYLHSVRQSEVVVDNPPLETSPPANPETAQLVITAPIVVGASRGAQIVACTVHPQPDNGASQPFHATAKIYDALYYNFQLELAPHPRDVVYEADRDYSTEAEAYEHLVRTGQTGSFAPAYYGSWTFCLPITSNGKTQTRPIRLVLMEHLDGTTIRNTRVQNSNDKDMGLDSFHYPEEYRLEVLARAMDGYVRQLQTGIDQRDFAGRNVVLVPQDSTPSVQPLEKSGGLALPRVVLIDYNHATIDNTLPEQHSSHPSLPENPVSAFWNAYLWEDFGGWVPNEWHDDKIQKQWLMQRFNRDGQRQHYLPLQEQVVRELKLDLETTTASTTEGQKLDH